MLTDNLSMRRISFTTITCLLVSSVYSWETDNFTHRRKIAKASEKEKNQNLYALNDETNKRIHKVIKDFNEEMDINCNEDLKLLKSKETTMWGSKKMPKIYMQMKDMLGGGLFGAMEKWSEKSDKVTRYGDGSYIYGKSIMGNFYNLQTAFNLNGHVVGPDKLGHFVDQGFELYEEFLGGKTPKEGFKKAMQHSNTMEDSYYGIDVSGVKSYGDMGANYSGMKFWYNLTGKDNSYIRCDAKSGKYKVNRDFDWAEFADDTWDQGINCSTFETAKNPYAHGQYRNVSQLFNTEKDKGLKQYLASVDKTLKCPDDLGKCQEISKKECSKYFVSPKCLFSANTKLSCKQNNFDKLLSVADSGGYKYERKEEEKPGWFDRLRGSRGK